MSNPLRIAIDGNEANVKLRVGSNVYAFEVLQELWTLTKRRRKFTCTVFLSQPPLKDLPPARNNWKYEVLKPRRLWTQWALPLHLFWHKKDYDVLFAPGHYAPRFSAIPYVSSVMDVAYLEFPEQFQKNDLFQLTHWTQYSVKRAKKVVTISQFSKQQIHKAYKKPLNDIVVATPAVSLPKASSPLRAKAFFRRHGIEEKNYVVYLGTLQPRKNLENLVEAFEIFSRFHAANQLKKRSIDQVEEVAPPPQLVLAGKIGWLAKSIQDRIEASPLKNKIIVPGFVSDDLKPALYKNARATVLVGFSEGFGIPPLESMSVGTIPVVSNTSSLPEVVGSAGITTDPKDPHAIADALKEAWNVSTTKKVQLEQRAQKQLAQFSWQKTGKTILNTLVQVARHGKKH